MNSDADFDEVVQRSSPYSKTLLLVLGAVMALAGLVFLGRQFEFLSIPLIIVIPLVLVFGIVIAAILVHMTSAAVPMAILIAGIILAAGGSVFDMSATITRSPQLDLESNPVTRSLLDSGTSVETVYAYGLVTQILIIVLSAILWVAFLKHRGVVVASAWASKPMTYLQFVKGATGGGHLSWRQYLLPLKLGDLPKSYHLLWLTVPIWIGASSYRWYLGFEWLMPSISGYYRAAVIIAVVLLSCAGYLIWLWVNYDRALETANG